MILASIKFAEDNKQKDEWSFEELSLQQINLLVGRNSTGKTRVLNIIGNLANLLSGKLKNVFKSGLFDVAFKHESKTYTYQLWYEAYAIEKEELHIDGVKKLHRGGGGMGWVYSEDIHQQLKFRVPVQEVAVVAKRDAIQHPFLEPLHAWGDTTRHFYFGTPLGKENFGLSVKGMAVELDDRNTSSIIPIFVHGQKEFEKAFLSAVIEDMAAVDYQLEDIVVARPTSVVVAGPASADVGALQVKEKDIPTLVDQISISQGMFRTLSLIIQVNYGIMKKRAECILVDDIGEGLDFERSCALIDLLRRKVQGTAVQLIMSTNDRFVMNRVPLEEWCLLKREGGVVRVRNSRNSKAAFDRFKITGLNNFDFFATDFIERLESNGQNGNLRRGAD
jgi:hypothetical protein